MEEQRVDMDIDMIDGHLVAGPTADDLAELEAFNTDDAPSHTPGPAPVTPTSAIPEDADQKPSEALPRPEAIYLHGVDQMSTRDIRVYCQDLALDKIEWINDTSCNLVFANEEVAREAAVALLVNDVEEPLTHKVLRKAKPFNTELAQGTVPSEDLHIRVATDWDVKERGARDRSRYYLLHGEGSHDIHDYDRNSRNSNNSTSSPSSTSILSRLGQRRERSSEQQQQARKTGNVLSRLGKRNDSRRRASPRREQRRSVSPRARQPRGSSPRDELPQELPESLKSRLGPRRSE